ncbi:hypothetical protein ACIA8K_36255 [Catenuloplanes sp. NPDC051500]|uniref:hypothetical protein n=1 Tax=Catenuloplanes sp. NPDC051500 TaxID=3363959 RepID=UPI0037A7BA7F
MMDEEFHALDDAFATFRDGSGSLPTPLGPSAARATVRRRRQLRAGITGGLTALLIAAPVAAYAAGVIGTNGPPADPATQPPAPPPSATASPSPSPTASPSPQSSEESPAPPDGRIDLKKGEWTLRLSNWPYVSKGWCAAGDITFTDGKSPGASSNTVPRGDIEIGEVTYVDIDSDGAEETAAVVTCTGIEMGESQVVVLDRDPAGNVITFGTALFTKADFADIRNLPMVIRGFEAQGNGLAVEVGDRYTCCGQSVDAGQWQWRVFSYAGGEFVQIGGPSEFPPNPLVTDLRVVSAIVEGSTTGDTFTGTLKITVRNAGPFKANAFVSFSLPRPATLKTVPMGCARDDGAIIGPDEQDRDFAYFCELGPTATGGDVTLETFQVTGPAADFVVGDQKVFAVSICAAVDPTGFPAGNKQLPDAKYDDNSVEKTFTVK